MAQALSQHRRSDQGSTSNLTRSGICGWEIGRDTGAEYSSASTGVQRFDGYVDVQIYTEGWRLACMCRLKGASNRSVPLQ